MYRIHPRIRRTPTFDFQKLQEFAKLIQKFPKIQEIFSQKHKFGLSRLSHLLSFCRPKAIQETHFCLIVYYSVVEEVVTVPTSE